ncbi:MAG TPA: PH domain-containing protein [Ktedonobacteraceae bacterium]|nr:PH domain-containing protein [Ktedonobacteraceae bacterium]
MSSNAPQNPQTNLWKKKRVHRVIRRFKRGPDGKLHFDGQQPDEEIRRIVREHPIFSVRSALPFVVTLVFTGFFIWGNVTVPQLGIAWRLIEFLAAVALVVTGAYGGYRIFELWWVNVDVVTNKRILTWHGLLSPTRKETTLDKVTQVAVDQDSIFAILVNFGDVKVYLAGGKDLDLLKVSNPKEVRDDIEGIRQSYKEKLPKKAPIPTVQDAQVSEVLAKLAKPEEVPKMEDADKKWEHRRDPRKLRGPLRTFGGPLRIPCEVHYDSEEYTVRYVQRSRIVLVYSEIIPVAAMIFLVFGALTFHSLLTLFVVAFFVDLLVIGLVFINYIDDVFILTNKRIIDIERKFIIFYEEHDTTTYDKVAEMTVKSPNIFELAFNIGDLYIRTPGSNPDIYMKRVSDPFALQDEIYAIKGFKEKVDKVKAKNDQKDQLNEWFSTVLSKLDTRINNRGVPDLQSKDLWEAMAQAGELGMRVIPIGESERYPHVPAGKIVEQSPPPGTMVSMEHSDPDHKPQIHVIVSKSVTV